MLDPALSNENPTSNEENGACCPYPEVKATSGIGAAAAKPAANARRAFESICTARSSIGLYSPVL